MLVFESRLALQEPPDDFRRPCSVRQRPMEEPGHCEHVAAQGVDAASDEQPQRLLQVVGAKVSRSVGEDQLLLVERKQVCQKQRVRLILGCLPLKVEDVEVFTVAVVVEVFVRVVERDGLAVFFGQGGVAGGVQRLSEGRAVLERKP